MSRNLPSFELIARFWAEMKKKEEEKNSDNAKALNKQRMEEVFNGS
jgi:hypothetical protein